VGFEREQGSSLIWFTAIATILLSILLTFASAAHQYFFARKLKDVTEQLVVTVHSLDPELSSPAATGAELLLVLQKQLPHLRLQEISVVDGKTLSLIACARWVSPLPIANFEREICQLSRSR